MITAKEARAKSRNSKFFNELLERIESKINCYISKGSLRADDFERYNTEYFSKDVQEQVHLYLINLGYNVSIRKWLNYWTWSISWEEAKD